MISKIIISASLVMKFIEYIFIFHDWPEARDMGGEILSNILKLNVIYDSGPDEDGLTRSSALSSALKGGDGWRRSGSTLSKSRQLNRGVERLA
jgi:hypothetical protein